MSMKELQHTLEDLMIPIRNVFTLYEDTTDAKALAVLARTCSRFAEGTLGEADINKVFDEVIRPRLMKVPDVWRTAVALQFAAYLYGCAVDKELVVISDREHVTD